MNRRTARILVSLSVVLLVGCSTAPTTRKAPTRSDLLTRDEIMSVRGASTLYDVVKRLRPRWLVVRAPDRSLGGMTTAIFVYLEQTLMGDVESLRELQPDMAYEMRWLDGATASATLPGLGSGVHMAGAIVIATRPPSVGTAPR